MSTKTTFKRIALVAVAALGFGMLSVVPSSATYPTTLSLGTPTNTSAAVTGQLQTMNLPVTFTTAAATDTVTVSAVIVAKPATSALALNSTAPVDAVAGGATTRATPATVYTGTASNNSGIWAITSVAVTSAAPLTVNQAFTFTPDVAGSYSIAYFIDGADATVTPTGLIKSGDPSIKYLTVTVVDQPAVNAVITQPVAGTFAVRDATSLSDGGWLRFNATNAAGTLTRIDAGQQMLITVPTGVTLRKKTVTDASNVSTITTGLTQTATTYGLTTSDFNAAGYTYLNFTAAAAGSYTVTASIAGQTATAASIAIVFKAVNVLATACGDATLADATTVTAPKIITTTGALQGVSTINVATTATSNTFGVCAAVAAATTTAGLGYVGVALVDSAKTAHGSGVALTADYAVLVADEDHTGGTAPTDGTSGLAVGYFSVPNALTATATSSTKTYSLFALGTSLTAAAITSNAITTVVTGEASGATNTYAGVTLKPASALKVVNGGSVTVTATYVDQYGAAKAGLAIVASVSGRNTSTVSTNLVTDATGLVSFSLTDAAPTSATLTDTITFTGGAAASFVITYVSSLVATTMTTSPSATTADTAAKAVDKGAIDVSGTPSDGADSVTATLKDANGVGIAGLPVTITLPAGVSLKSTSPAVAYTSSTGVATWSVYTSTAGTYALTFAGGGLTKTSYLKWTAGSARVVSVTSGTSSNGITPVTIKVTDAYGNGVASTAVSLVATGGYFQGLPMTSSQNTSADGSIVVAFVGSGSVKATISGGQSLDLAGYVGTTAVAGFPAGVASATAAADGGTSAAETASDAAAEATDAANAATDAANAAAEAADAATAAAQDAADAVAALSAQVASLISGLKAQLTALTNLVIKIQKKVKA